MSANILFKRLIICILCSALTSIVSTQSRLDMFLDIQPQRIELPSNYEQSQANNQQPHRFKIKFQKLYTIGYEDVSSEHIDRLYYITSYFYSILIKVQNIPQNQTKFPKDPLDGIARCFDQEVPQSYSLNGFSTEDQDLIIFTKQHQSTDQTDSGVGACVVERRPLYGLFQFNHHRLRYYQDYANFHNTLVRVIHSTLHILGFNTNFIVKGQHTLITEIQNHLNDQTFFFENALSNRRLLVKEVIEVYYGDLNLTIVKTKTVKQAVRQIFECSQTEQVGAALETVFLDYDGQYFRFHWHPQIYQDQFMVFVQAKYNIAQSELQKQNQQLKISKLSWAMLWDTGFYQQIDHSLIDNFKPRTFQSFFYKWNNLDRQIIPKCQMHKNLYAQEYFLQHIHCNVYGTSMRNTYYSILYHDTFQQKSKFKQNKCTKMSPYFRCLEIMGMRNMLSWYQTYQQCTYTECVNNTIRIMFNGIWHNICTKEQAGIDKRFDFRTNYTIHCPSDFDAFCGERICENWCEKEGICINGECHYPQTRFQAQLRMQNLQYSFYPIYKDWSTQKYITGKVCSRGCLDCQNFPKQTCKVKRIHHDDYNRNLPICPFAIKGCLQFVKKIIPCFQNYFYLNQRCHKCDSSCTHCQQTYGSLQMINLCKNCQEGKFPFAQICKNCQVENCMSCKEKGQCQKCKLNYYLPAFETSTKGCIRCLSNCGICDPKNISRCLGCGEGFFLSIDINQCQNCLEFCQKCKNNSVCIQCYKGFIKRQNACVRPCELPCHQCILGQPSKCLSCVSYHRYNPNNHSCEQIYFESKYNCPLGYYSAIQNYQAKCIQIPIINCIIATQGQQMINDNFIKIPFCNLCAKGFFINQINKCQPCPQGCSRCFQNNVCDVCDDGFSNPKNRDGSRNTVKCQKCAQNCLLCPASPVECQLCSDNYGLIGTSCHSVNRVKVQFTFDVDYRVFLRQNTLQNIKIIVLGLIDQKSRVQINRVEKGSVKVFGVISRSFQGQVEKDCMLSYNLTSKLSNSVEFGFPLIEASLTNNIAECDTFAPSLSVQIVYIITAIASIVIIVFIFITVYLVRKLAIKEKIILKFEELQSRPQYLAQSQIKVGF